MNEHVKKENRRALPKFFLVLLVSAVFGGVVGFGAGVAGAAGLPEKLTAWMNDFWYLVTPWAIPATSAVLLGSAGYQYRRAKRAFAAWDGEDEETIDTAEQTLSWALLWTSLALVLDFFFLAAGNLYFQGSMHGLAGVGWFVLSAALIMVMQQKVVDLTKRMNPEKHGSVYDMKFQKHWMDSCDEAEQKQIGQAAYKAFQVTTTVCVSLWLALVVLNFTFDFGLMPVFVLTVIWGTLQVSYALECIRLSAKKK